MVASGAKRTSSRIIAPVWAIAMFIDPINNDGEPLGNTLRTCSIGAKVGSSQIPN
jgi:hypothetical protein